MKPETWIYFVAQLELLGLQTQARSRPVFTGLRPGWRIPAINDVTYVDGALIVPNNQTVMPGDRSTILIVPTSPELWEHVASGTHIEMCEGPHVIGNVTILDRRQGDPFSQ